jgi:hypothetical protein
VQIGLFDAFGDGWGEGAALRIYDRNDPSSYLDISNLNKAFVESNVCLNPTLALYTEVACNDCSLSEPWEMFYTITEGKKKKSMSYVGTHNTVMSIRDRKIKIVRNPIDYDAKQWICKQECDRYGIGARNDFWIYDMKGEGKCQ